MDGDAGTGSVPNPDTKEIDGVVHVRRKVLKITEVWEPRKKTRCTCEEDAWEPHVHCKHTVCCHCDCDFKA